MTPLTHFRQFWAGVCKVPDKGRVWYLNCLVDERDSTIARMAEDLTSVRRWLRESQERRATLSGERDALQSELVDMARQRDSIVGDLTKQLAAEREAHKETKRSLVEEHHWRMVNHNNCNRLGGELNYANEQTDKQRELLATITEQRNSHWLELSAARADLEALTQWRPQGVDYLPADVRALCATRNGDEYRHTPESLAAWKARKGSGSDAH